MGNITTYKNRSKCRDFFKKKMMLGFLPSGSCKWNLGSSHNIRLYSGKIQRKMGEIEPDQIESAISTPERKDTEGPPVTNETKANVIKIVMNKDNVYKSGEPISITFLRRVDWDNIMNKIGKRFNFNENELENMILQKINLEFEITLMEIEQKISQRIDKKLTEKRTIHKIIVKDGKEEASQNMSVGASVTEAKISYGSSGSKENKDELDVKYDKKDWRTRPIMIYAEFKLCEEGIICSGSCIIEFEDKQLS